MICVRFLQLTKGDDYIKSFDYSVIISILMMLLLVLIVVSYAGTHDNETGVNTIEESVEDKQSSKDVVNDNYAAPDSKEVLEEVVYKKYYTDQDAIDIAKVLYNECRGVPSETERACVAWVVLNRVDANNSNIHDVVRAPYQFAFSTTTTVDPALLELSYDVLERWNSEKNNELDVGRVLPPEYVYFEGDGRHNYFRNRFSGSYSVWDYSSSTPYDS